MPTLTDLGSMGLTEKEKCDVEETEKTVYYIDTGVNSVAQT